MVPFGQMGRDHWTVLTYIETLCVDRAGVPDVLRFRCHPKTHPVYFDFQMQQMGASKHIVFEPPRGSTLRDGTELAGHDDLDCTEDLQVAGLIEVSKDPWTHTPMTFSLTDAGWLLAGRLRRWRADGGKAQDFDPQDSHGARFARGAECSTEPPAYPWVGTAEVERNTPEHVDIRHGGVLFCFRVHREGEEEGWEGPRFLVGGQVIDPDWLESAAITAVQRLHQLLAERRGEVSPDAPVKLSETRCPECHHILLVPPGPILDVDCGPEHVFTFQDGRRFAVDAGGAPRALENPR